MDRFPRFGEDGDKSGEVCGLILPIFE